MDTSAENADPSTIPLEAGQSKPLAPLPTPEEEPTIVLSVEEIVKKLADEPPVLGRRRLAGASLKRLRRLLKSGVPYNIALKIVVEKIRIDVPQHGTSKPVIATDAKANKKPKLEAEKSEIKVPESDTSTSANATDAQEAKKPKLEGKPFSSTLADSVKIALVHSQQPDQQLSKEQLVLLQSAILASVDELTKSADPKQIRFESCTFRPGFLSIVCTDQESSEWLLSSASTFKPWEGASIKAVVGEAIPKTQVCVAYIVDDEAGKRLTQEVILGRLALMNTALPTSKWVVLNRQESGPGQTWTFAIDEASVAALEALGWRPYFGFGRVQFRLKTRGGDQPASSEASTRRFAKRPPPAPGPFSTSRTISSTGLPMAGGGRYLTKWRPGQSPPMRGGQSWYVPKSTWGRRFPPFTRSEAESSSNFHHNVQRPTDHYDG